MSAKPGSKFFFRLVSHLLNEMSAKAPYNRVSKKTEFSGHQLRVWQGFSA
jgi:hypothetical protein